MYNSTFNVIVDETTIMMSELCNNLTLSPVNLKDDEHTRVSMKSFFVKIRSWSTTCMLICTLKVQPR